ncbi:hypothetical protein SMD44_08826 [Streptomyces alboflavus]|uniref:Uncharacterized protein n=1 Tax=Streptomyces alboflavus TaxID=67267 RepID=A0A1Z1WSH2_9ACTN|nr:hypothetical protein SMD44_08826 [Streptomyces alboflavus]
MLERPQETTAVAAPDGVEDEVDVACDVLGRLFV